MECDPAVPATDGRAFPALVAGKNSTSLKGHECPPEFESVTRAVWDGRYHSPSSSANPIVGTLGVRVQAGRLKIGGLAA